MNKLRNTMRTYKMYEQPDLWPDDSSTLEEIVQEALESLDKKQCSFEICDKNWREQERLCRSFRALQLAVPEGRLPKKRILQ